MKYTFVIFARHFDSPVIGAASNLKEVHRLLVHHFATNEDWDEDKCPSYKKLVADFKDRKKYVEFSNHYYVNDDFNCYSVDVSCVAVNVDF